MSNSKDGSSDGLIQMYDRPFFTKYGVANPVYARSCTLIAQEIARRFTPANAVDWGCGAGLHVTALQKAGVDALGVDGVVPPPDLRVPDVEIQRADLRYPIKKGVVFEHYDLSLCLDVLEHIPEAHSQQALENITRGARLLLLSCAPPGQGGHNHVNEQPRRYWVARLAAMKWKYDRKETGALERTFLARRSELPISWMYHNVCVYRPTFDSLKPVDGAS